MNPMLPTQVQKRNGKIVSFAPERITIAIQKTIHEIIDKAEHLFEIPTDFAEELQLGVLSDLKELFVEENKIPSVENIQDVVEKKLVESGYIEIARAFILYRADRARLRAETRIKELKLIDKHKFNIIKNSGEEQPFNIKKIKRIFKRAVVGFESECEFQELFRLFKTKVVPNINTKEILSILIRCSIDLISIENVSWQNIAGRLYCMQLYKEATRNREIQTKKVYSSRNFKKHFDSYIEEGLYYKDFYKYYTKSDIREMGDYIVGERDFSYIFSTILTFDKRYLLNPNHKVCELPQEMYLTIALFLAIPEKDAERMDYAKKIYDVISTQKVSLPTPTLLNARTNYHQLASCFKINMGDDLRAIYHSFDNVAQISKFGGGVGTYMGHIRSKGGSIRGVQNVSGGVIPWIRVLNATACAVNQLGSRAGAVSPTLDVWHRDIFDFLNLQTETGDIRTKAFDVFPAISVPDLFMKRVEQDTYWTLMDPHEIKCVMGKSLEDHFSESFESFYVECENNKELALNKKVKAKDLMKDILKCCVETGMPYFFFRDTVNDANPNKHVGNIYSTQLCTEICQNTKATTFSTEDSSNPNKLHLEYETGETVVCNLASINMAKVHTKEDIESVIPIAMRVLDNVITLNFYPIEEAKVTAEKYRSVGLGFMGLGEYLACKKLGYDTSEARQHIDELFEQYAFTTLKASNNLAIERGQYELFTGSEWEKGKLFGRGLLWYKKNTKNYSEWKTLLDSIQKEGLRFSYHISPAPNTSTSVVMGTTAGLLPIYKRFFVETNSLAPIITVAPKLSGENFWFYKEYSQMDMNDVIAMIATIYKWVDQSISFEWLINPAKTSPKQLYDYYFKAWNLKIKTIYYVRSMSVDAHEICESCAG